MAKFKAASTAETKIVVRIILVMIFVLNYKSIFVSGFLYQLYAELIF